MSSASGRARARVVFGPALVGLVVLTIGVRDALTAPLQRFDEGIELAAASFLRHGVMPIRDAYIPYGPGLGLAGLPAELLFGPDGVAQRLSRAVIVAICAALLTALAARRTRLSVALAIGIVPFAFGGTSRYALPTIVVLLFALGIDSLARTAAAGTLESAVAERGAALALLSALLGTAAWFRPEYVVLSVLWAAVLLRGVRVSRRTILLGATGVLVAIAPFVAFAATGGARHVFWWWRYALFGFRRYRGQPIDWALPGRWLWAVAHGHFPSALGLGMISYVAGILLVLAWLAQVALPRRFKPFQRDPTLLFPFLVLVTAYVVYAQSVRFSGENGRNVAALVWAGIAVAPFRRPKTKAVAAAIGLVAIASGLAAFPHAPGAIRAAWATDGAAPQVPRLGRMPLSDAERPSLAAIEWIWRRQVPTGSPVFVAGLRNDDAQGNEPVLYWLLDARPAAWPAVYDPGLADRLDVQQEVVERLCRTRAPVVQLRPATVYGSFAAQRHGSRLLDEFLPLQYRVAAVTPYYRLLLARSGPCADPGRIPATAVRSRQAQLLRTGDLVGAGALSVLLIDRALAHSTPPLEADVAAALAGGFWQPDDLLPSGALGAALRALREQRADPALAAVAADPPANAVVALAVQTGYVTLENGAATPRQRIRVLAALWTQLERHPRWPDAFDNLTALEPPGPDAFIRLRRIGVSGPDALRWEFDYRASLGDLPGALALARRLLPAARNAPVEQAQVFDALAQVFAARGDERCAAAARVAASVVPGVEPHAPPAGACRGLPGGT